MSERRIGIMGAMTEEIEGIVNLLSDKEEVSIGMRTYFSGKLFGIDTVVVFSRWGKVAAATTVSTLILEFKITELIFTGVAGAINSDLRIGDIVIANHLIQHDMDARPLMNRFEIPLLGKTFFESSEQHVNNALNAVNLVIDNKLSSIIEVEELLNFGLDNPKVYVGDTASGDKFFSSNEDKAELLKHLPTVLCVEMEGASVAQVCYEYSIPFVIIRTISDTADENSSIDFPSFIQSVSSKYSLAIVKNIYEISLKLERSLV